MDIYLQVWLAASLTVLAINTTTQGSGLGVVKDTFFSAVLGGVVTLVFWGIGLMVGG